jgi:hypothetical protein
MMPRFRASSVTHPLGDIVIGPDSQLTRWVFDVVRRLAEAGSSRAVAQIDRTDQVEFLAVPHPILLTHYPGNDVVDAIERGDLRVLYVVEDPIDVVLFQRLALSLPTTQSIRAQTASAVANLAIGGREDTLIVDRATDRNVTQVVSRIVEHLEPTIPPTAREAVIEAVAGAAGRRGSLESALADREACYLPPSGRGTGTLIDTDLMLAAEIVDPLISMARGRTGRPVVWPTAAFSYADAPGLPAPASADISGPVRTLYYGPYLHLPPARYRVEAILAFSDEIREVAFTIEVHAAHWLARARIEQGRSGAYRGYFFITHHDAVATVEIRLRNEQGVARGRLSLIELMFFPVADDSASA